MKAVLVSIKPKWCAKIMNGKKTIEVRTSKALANAIQKLIDKYGYADIYVYCSKDSGNLVYGTEYHGGNFIDEYGITRGYSKQKANEIFGLLNGKIVFKFCCYKVEEIYYECGNNGISVDGYKWFYTEEIDLVQNFEKASCLNEYELFDYLKPKEAGGTPCGYAIHISNLEIFDEPKELSKFKYVTCPKTNCEYCKYNKTVEGDLYCTRKTLTKAPQNFCYVEVL